MAGASGGVSLVKSPQEIEDEIISTQTVTWDPFTILPKEIYLEIFDKLENPNDKRNFMNAHEEWRELFKSRRTRFLFGDVLTEVIKTGKLITREDLFNFRLVNHDSDDVVQKHFQLNSSNFQLDTLTIGGSRGARSQSLVREMLMGGRTVGRDLLTRNPYFSYVAGVTLENAVERFGATHPPSKNPILSRKLGIFPSLVGDDDERLERYRTAVDNLLEVYGSHIWHCTVLAVDLKPLTCLQIAKWLGLMPELKTFYLYYASVHSTQLTWTELKEIKDLEVIQPELDKLKVLKTDGVPAEVFNKLFGSVKEVEKIQIRLRKKESFLKNFEPKREGLNEAFFTIKCLQDINHLGKGDPFRNLKKLTILIKFNRDSKALWMHNWSKVFKALEEKAPGLEDLSIRLPKVLNLRHAKIAKEQSLESRLNLPKLRKMWVAFPHFSSIDFLINCKALEDLKVVLEHQMASSEVRRDWGGVGKEKIKFVVDLGTLKESNVWEELPKLKVLEVKDGSACTYHYEKKK